MTPFVLQCEKCHQDLNEELFDCPDRVNHTCPYTVGYDAAKRVGASLLGIGMLAVFLLLANFFVARLPTVFTVVVRQSFFYFLFDNNPEVVTILCIIGLGCTFCGIVLLGQNTRSLKNATTGQMWVQYRFLRKVRSEMAVTGFQLVSIPHSAIRASAYPVSVLALAQYVPPEQSTHTQWILYVSNMVYHTILTLVSNGSLILHYLQVSLNNRVPTYHFVLQVNDALPSHSISGLLERVILQTVQEHAISEVDPRFLLYDVSILGPSLPIEFFPRALLATVKKIRVGTQQFSWLIFSQTVAEDASQRKLVQLTKGRFGAVKDFVVLPDMKEELIKAYTDFQTQCNESMSTCSEVAQKLQHSLIQMVEQGERMRLR